MSYTKQKRYTVVMVRRLLGCEKLQFENKKVVLSPMKDISCSLGSQKGKNCAIAVHLFINRGCLGSPLEKKFMGF